jgi:hypothetical protein
MRSQRSSATSVAILMYGVDFPSPTPLEFTNHSGVRQCIVTSSPQHDGIELQMKTPIHAPPCFSLLVVRIFLILEFRM